MFRRSKNENFSDYSYMSTPKPSVNLKVEVKEKPILSEWKLAVYGLVLSLFVLTTKLFYANREVIQKTVFEQRLITFEVIAEDGQVMFGHAWKTALRFSRLWFPVLCGVFATYFTWNMVYLDSNVPGVQPPSPLSPKKYKERSGHTFHLNYVFAVLIGILVTSYMFWKQVSLSY